MKILFKRLGAYAVDWYLYAVVLIAFNTLYSTIKGIEPTYFMTLEQYDKQDMITVMLLMFIIHIFLFVILVKVFKGQTIGKKLFRLRIVSNDDKPVTMGQLFLREVVGLVLIEGYFSPISSYFRTFLAMQYGNIVLIHGIWYAIVVISLILARLTKNHRMIHDLISNTKVIETIK